MIKFIMKAPLSDLALKFVDFLVLNDVTKQEELLGFFVGKYYCTFCFRELCES